MNFYNNIIPNQIANLEHKNKTNVIVDDFF